jgi:hypothetical protein
MLELLATIRLRYGEREATAREQVPEAAKI